MMSINGSSSYAFYEGSYITEYRWRIDGVTVSESSSFGSGFTLEEGQSQASHEIELRVRDEYGTYGYETTQITITRGNNSHYYLTDHLGSVRVTVDETGEPVGWDDYYPFGLQMEGRSWNAGSFNDLFKFTGHELEQQGGLGIYHAGARLYDPEVGRFLQMDPILLEMAPGQLMRLHNGKLLGYNPYHYTFNNPLRYIDPDGKNPWNVIPARYNPVTQLQGMWNTAVSTVSNAPANTAQAVVKDGPAGMDVLTVGAAGTAVTAGGVALVTGNPVAAGVSGVAGKVAVGSEVVAIGLTAIDVAAFDGDKSQLTERIVRLTVGQITGGLFKGLAGKNSVGTSKAQQEGAAEAVGTASNVTATEIMKQQQRNDEEEQRRRDSSQ